MEHPEAEQAVPDENAEEKGTGDAADNGEDGWQVVKRKRPARKGKKDAWKGTIRKKKAPQQNIQEQQEAFDVFLNFIQSGPEEDKRKLKGDELPQFNPEALDKIKPNDEEESLASPPSGEEDKADAAKDEEKQKQEEEEKKQQELRALEEAENKQKAEEEKERRRIEEERRKAEEEARRLEEEEKRRVEEARRKQEEEMKRKQEEDRLRREQQREDNLRKFQQMAPRPTAKRAAMDNKFATLRVQRTTSAAHMAIPVRTTSSRPMLVKGTAGTTSSKSLQVLAKDLAKAKPAPPGTSDDWEQQVLSRWSTFMETAKKAKAAAAPAPVTEEDKKTQKKREDDALLIIGALKKMPAPVAPAEPSESAPAETPEPPKKRELMSPEATKDSQTPYLLNMYKYKSVHVDFADLFGDADTFSSPGVHVWCINPQGPAIQEAEVDGRFSVNGSYLVLQTVGSGDSVEHKVHTWAPSTSTKFTSVAAVYAALLTSHLGRAHITHHIKDQEEPEFYGCFFPQEVEYTNDVLQSLAAPTPRAPKPIGRKGLIEHVGFSTPLTSSECYVLIAQQEGAIYVRVGSDASTRAKGRTYSFARDARHYFYDSLELVTFDEGKEPARFIKHLTPPKPKGESAEDEGEEGSDLVLYTVKQGTGKLDLKEVPGAEAPFNYNYLTAHGTALIIDWYLGVGCPKPIRRGSEECAKLFFKHYARPEWAKVWVIQPGKANRAGERQFLHPFFAQFFVRAPVTSLRAAPSQKVELHSKIKEEVAGFLSGKLGVTKKEELKKPDPNRSVEVWGTVPKSTNFRKLPPSSRGQFYRNDSALVVVNNPGDERVMPSASMYWWQGAEADAKSYQHFYFGMYQALAKKMQEEDYPRPVVHYVNEHKEPAEFAELFGGNIIIHLGSRTGSHPALGRLYHLRKSSPDVAHLCEVELEVSSLNSVDTFLLLAGTTGPIYVWRGSVAEDSRSIADSFAHRLVENAKVETATEGKEPQEFWDILGRPKDRDQLTSADVISRYANKVKLYTISNETGQPEVAIVHSFWASDLTPSRVVILDAYYEIYLWVGNRISGSTEVYANAWVKEFVAKARESRKIDLEVVTVLPKHEPAEFTRHFQAWFRPAEKPDVLEVRREKIRKAALEEYREKIRAQYKRLFGEDEE